MGSITLVIVALVAVVAVAPGQAPSSSDTATPREGPA
jgi:hypothetical protein